MLFHRPIRLAIVAMFSSLFLENFSGSYARFAFRVSACSCFREISGLCEINEFRAIRSCNGEPIYAGCRVTQRPLPKTVEARVAFLATPRTRFDLRDSVTGMSQWKYGMGIAGDT